VTLYYYSTEYPNEKQDMDEFFEYIAYEYEDINRLKCDINWLTEDIAKVMYYGHDGWEWWKYGQTQTIHLWDSDRNYLGHFDAEYEVEPSFITRDIVKP
jgi:hypothetical protein